ncbi:MAG: hypothetical protein LBK03_00110 [Bacteroidales bacterium]|jgi:hypothetical protein|nr:hypothetical protein [Bacteroidales bacterium]
MSWNSTHKIRIIAISTIAALLLGIGGYLLWNKGNLRETIKRESAKQFDYEYIPNQNIVLDSRMVTFRKDSLYADFRRHFRLHYQTLAMGVFADSSRLLLISEPPPYFELDSIRTLFVKFTHSIETRYHRMGYDGRVTDILISIANATTENMQNIIKALAKQLYLSDYKAFAMPLPVEKKRAYFAKETLDYQISLDEFNQWFLKDKELFVSQKDTIETDSIQSIFTQRKRGVFFSKIPGFIAWAIPKKGDLGEYVHDIRQFTLDADLILGALADSATLIIIGREREAPLYELPPLNVESVLLLASITEKELSQSLDVNDFMAGKMPNGHDWCPTYLSKELENTEIGHLLTITDILLKDWSENGSIQEAYYRYPEPNYYPFDRPLFRKLGLNELVYNWNTDNAMYAIDLENVTIYTPNHTGALPVSYFNSQERSISIGHRYELQAYHYFATLNNTDLARVVQYTTLYQLFTDNEIYYSGNIHSSPPKNKAYLLYKPVLRLLGVFKNMSSKEITCFADTLSHIQFRDYQNKQVDEAMLRNENDYHFTYSATDRDRIYQDIKGHTTQQIAQEFYGMRQLLNGLSEENLQRLAKYLSYPRGFRLQNRTDYTLYLQARQTNQLLRTIGKNHLPLLHIDLNEVKNFYVNNLASSSARYLKTPSIIITYNDMLTTGGHNLSSRISRVKSTANYKRNNYHPTDYSRPVVENAPATPTPLPVKTPANTPAKDSAPRPTTVITAPPKSKNASTTGKATSPQANTRPRSTVISSAPRGTRGF